MGSILDTIQTSPTYTTTLISNNKKVKYRSYTSGEEQALLTAKESGDVKVMLEAAKDIINKCTYDEIDVDSLASFDIEYLFLLLRSKSVGEEIELLLPCKNEECGYKNEIIVNIEDIKKPKLEKDSNIVKFSDDLQFSMKYPGFNVLDQLADGNVSLFSLVGSLIETIFYKDNVYETSDLPPEELENFVKKMTSKSLKLIVHDFLNKVPKLNHTVKFTCVQCKNKSEYKFEGLNNFFV
jgi:hypothetical protein